jgi:ABC-2 type transport system permease protein
MNPASNGPAPRIAPHAWHALGGIWRLTAHRYATAGHWLTLAGALVVLFLFSIPAAPANPAAAGQYLPWVARFYICFLVPVLAYVLAAAAMRQDLGGTTADYVLTRPVGRPALVAFRYLAHVACTQIDFLFGLALLGAVGVYHGIPGIGPALPLLLLAQVLAILAFSALGFLFGVITSRYVIVGLVYGAAIEVGLGNTPTQLSHLSLLRQLLGLLRPILGDDAGAVTGTLGAPATGFVLIVFSAAAVGATALLFRFREFAGSAREA